MQQSLGRQRYKSMTSKVIDSHNRLRPDNEHKMWRWALRLAISAFLVLTANPDPAKADVQGTVCVENGGVISIGGKRSSGQCVDGTMVRLYGVAAPGLDQECKVGGGEVWRCGLASAAALLQAVKGREVECRGNSTDSEGRLVALCFIAGRSVNQFMVEMGWAEADRTTTSMYNDIEQVAREARRGLWSSDFSPTTD